MLRSLLRRGLPLAAAAATAVAATVDVQSSAKSAAGHFLPPKGLMSSHPPTVVTKKNGPHDPEPTITIEYFALRALGVREQQGRLRLVFAFHHAHRIVCHFAFF